MATKTFDRLRTAEWPSSGLTVLGVWAHPDDEAYLSSGLMYRAIQGGGRVACVHATHGGLGTTDPQTWPAERLARHRARELHASLAGLGVTDHRFLDYQDGSCDRVDETEAATRIALVMEDVRPDLVVTFGPDGITGHPDHRAVSRWTTAAWVATRQGQLLYAALSASFMGRFADVHARLGLFPTDAVGLADDRIERTVRLTPREMEVKRRALAAHASQTAPLARAMGEDTYRRWCATEDFRRPTRAELAKAAASEAVT